MIPRLLPAAVLALAALAFAGAPPASAPATAQAYASDGIAFETYLEVLKARARSEGVSAATVERMTAGLTPNPRVIQLDRTQPGLPLKKGRAATMTHDYKRHGTTTLFAALDVKSGMVIGECLPRHRAKEFLRFLRRIDRAVLKPRDVHLVLDTSFDRLTKRPPVQVLVPTTTNEDATYLETTSAVSGMAKNGQESAKNNNGSTSKKDVMRRLYYQ
jgi:hypothetical protein